MNRFLRLTLSFSFLVLLSSCEKDETDYSLDVIVTVDGNVRAQNALVHIYAPVDNTFVDYYLYTDEEGKVSIQLPNKAVVEIVSSKPPYKGCTFAELDLGHKTVRLNMLLYNDENNGCRDNQ